MQKNLKMNNSQVLEKFTEKIPLKRLATLEDISAVTLFLASDDSSYMTGRHLMLMVVVKCIKNLFYPP